MKTIMTNRVDQAAMKWLLLLLLGLGWPLAMRAAEAPPADAKPAEAKGDAEAKKDGDTKPEAEAKKDAEEKTGEEESLEARIEKYNNWLDLSFGYLTLRGDSAAFQQRHYTKKGFFGGIEDLHVQGSIDKKTSAQMDGRVLFDNSDYKIKLEVVREGLGFIRGGFSETRYWYDGSGGFFPQTGAWLDYYDGRLSLDRGEVWVETGLTLKKWPVITFKYTHQFRDGTKDSTSWGYYHPFGVGPVRAISPTYWDIDERRNIFEADLKHTIGKVSFGAGLRYDTSDNDNARKIREFAKETTTDHITSREVVKYDVLNAHAFAETRFHKNVFMSVGYAYSTLDSDLAGSRIYGSDYDVGYQPIATRGNGFISLTGGSQAKEHLMNLNLMLNPWPNLAIIPALRLNQVGMDSTTWYLQTDPLLSGPQAAASSRDVLDLTEQLELRYIGFTNWVLYARGEWMQGDGDLTELGASGLPVPVNRYTEDRRWGQKYTIGANWYTSRRMNWDFQAYHKSRHNDYDLITDNTLNTPASGNRYPAFLANHDFTTEDANVRLTLRPLKNVTLVSRYDIQYSTVDSTPDAAALLGEVESARILTHVFAQNVTWVPWSRLYLQAGFNYVVSKTESPADAYTQAVLDAKNNYWNLNFAAGFVMDDKTDLQAHYFYYRAFDNYYDNSAFGVPYGANAREHAVTASITRRLRDNLRVSLKYGFFTYHDASAGGYNNYDAHLIYSTLQLRF